VDPLILEYIVSMAEATRRHDEIYLGASPRGTLGLLASARAWAALAGRDYVLPDDVKALAEPVLAHRLIVSPAARMRNIDGRGIVRELLQRVPVPGATPFNQRVEGRPRGARP
jgi:MoxR-like ATPase